MVKTLQEKMQAAAENLNFEEAARIRDRIQAVERVLEKQRIISTEGQDDQDVIAFASDEDETCMMTFFFRNGKLIGREFFILQGTRDSSPGEVMASFLQQFYESSPHIPPELVVEAEPDDRAVIQSWLREKRNGAISITAPKRGDKLRLIVGEHRCMPSCVIFCGCHPDAPSDQHEGQRTRTASRWPNVPSAYHSTPLYSTV